MKPKIFGLAVLLMLCTILNAQQPTISDMRDSSYAWVQLKEESRFYINIHGGYALGLGSTFKFYPDDIRTIRVLQIENAPPSKTTSFTAPTKGLGQGLRFGVGLSYIVNDFINVGLDVDYFQSTISKTRDSSYYSIQSVGQPLEFSYTEQYKISYETKLLTFTPHLIFKAISRPKYYIYNKVGLVATFRPNSFQRETTTGNYRMGWQGSFRDSSANMEKVYDWGIRNPSIGFMGGIGVQFKLNGRMRVYGEMQFSHLVFVVRDRTVSSYKVDGRELVQTLPLAERELTFERRLTSAELNNSPNQPSRTIIQRIPITYVGAQAGVAYRF